jgi:hypothetical protein
MGQDSMMGQSRDVGEHAPLGSRRTVAQPSTTMLGTCWVPVWPQKPV